MAHPFANFLACHPVSLSKSQYVSLTLIFLLHAHGIIRPNSILHFYGLEKSCRIHFVAKKNLCFAILDLEPKILRKPVFPTQGTIRTHRIPSFLPTWSDNHLISTVCYQSREGGTNQEHFKRESTLIIITVVALLTDTLESGQLYLRSPSQNPVFLNSNKISVF